MGSPLSVDRKTLLALAGQARLIANPPGQIPPGALAGERVSKQQGRGLNFDSLRRYQPGDDVRLIDWQATARLRTPWIRLYNEERERPVFLIVDQRLDMFFATRGQTKSVAAANIAGLLAWRSWHDGDPLGSVVFNDTDCSLRKCRSPTTQLHPVLDDILNYNQLLPERYPAETPASVSLASVLQQASRMIPTGAWVALLSDFHDLDAASEALLAGLRRRCEVSAFVILDDLHLTLPAHGHLAASYQGRETSFSLSPALKNDIQRSITTRLALQKNRLTRLGIRVNQIVVAQDLVRQLQKGI
ncbi:ATPase [Enterobacterales bacterium]|nr:ATPase [Enterobacterales bacterium]